MAVQYPLGKMGYAFLLVMSTLHAPHLNWTVAILLQRAAVASSTAARCACAMSHVHKQQSRPSLHVNSRTVLRVNALQILLYNSHLNGKVAVLFHTRRHGIIDSCPLRMRHGRRHVIVLIGQPRQRRQRTCDEDTTQWLLSLEPQRRHLLTLFHLQMKR